MDGYSCREDDGPTQDFIICSSDQAMVLFSKGLPTLPVLILKGLNNNRTTYSTIKDVLSIIRTSEDLAIIRYNAVAKKKGGHDARKSDL